MRLSLRGMSCIHKYSLGKALLDIGKETTDGGL